MAHVITRACCNDRSCVDVCPVDCIHPATWDDPDAPEMLYIDPRLCIDCGSCVTECPAGAIHPDKQLPLAARDFLDINRDATADRDVREPVRPRSVTAAHAGRRPLSIAVVGSGPSGLYAVDELLTRTGDNAEVHVFERLPTPWGLARSGVAPDHLDTKGVTNYFAARLRDPRVTWHLSVDVGADLQLSDLQERFDAVILATGLSAGRRLGIPGETLPGSFTAADFVGWYNGHPDHQAHRFDLGKVSSVVIVGTGNVALDLARVLASDAAALTTSDMPDRALQVLSTSSVRRVVVLGRRGIAEAAFTTPELVSLGHLPGVGLVLSESQRKRTAAPGTLGAIKEDLMLKLTSTAVSSDQRAIEFRFGVSPTAVVGDTEVEGVCVTTERGADHIEADLVISAVGFERASAGLFLGDVPGGALPNTDGRVTGMARTYVTGWLKRGPSGALGTNRACSKETVDTFLLDVDSGRLSPRTAHRSGVGAWLRDRGVPDVTWEDWRALDRVELEVGRQHGRPREKVVDHGEMAAIINAHRAEPGANRDD